MGVKSTGPPSLVTISAPTSAITANDHARLPSIVAMSWVHRVMIRDVGVSSSQLEKKVCQYDHNPATLTDRRVEPNTESTSFALIDLDARWVPA